MTCDRDDLTKVAKFIGEARSLHIAVLPPDINQAGNQFAATKEGIRFAMSGIKGIGQAAVDHILEERKKGGPYKSLYDFIRRTDKARVGKKQIELLCEAGCFDFTMWTRDALKSSVEAMFEHASREQTETAKGILDLFASVEESNKDPFPDPPTVVHKSSRVQLLQREKELLGFYLTVHPM